MKGHVSPSRFRWSRRLRADPLGELFRALGSMRNRPRRTGRRRNVLGSIEFLEPRLNPATYWWIGASSGSWNSAANWAAASGGTGVGAVPGPGDNAVFNATAHVVNQINSFGAAVTVNSVL